MSAETPKEPTSRTWYIHLAGRTTFSMGGADMTKAEALEVARSIWAKLPAEDVQVSLTEKL